MQMRISGKAHRVFRTLRFMAKEEKATPDQHKTLVPDLLDDQDRHILRRALIALCSEYEGEANTPEFHAKVWVVARKLGIEADLLKIMTLGGSDGPGNEAQSQPS